MVYRSLIAKRNHLGQQVGLDCGTIGDTRSCFVDGAGAGWLPGHGPRGLRAQGTCRKGRREARPQGLAAAAQGVHQLAAGR